MAYEILGDFEHTCADYEAARQRARATDDRQGEWQALLDLALLWGGRDYARVGDFVQRVLEIARDAGDPIRLAHTLNRLGNWYTNVERPRKALQCHQEALDIFEGLQDRRWLDGVLDAGSHPSQGARLRRRRCLVPAMLARRCRSR